MEKFRSKRLDSGQSGVWLVSGAFWMGGNYGSQDRSYGAHRSKSGFG